MNYINRLSLFIILVVVGWLIYKKQQDYMERFDNSNNNKKKLEEADKYTTDLNSLCNNSSFKLLQNQFSSIRDMVKIDVNLLNLLNVWRKMEDINNTTKNLVSQYSLFKEDFEPITKLISPMLKDLNNNLMRYVINDGRSTSYPKSVKESMMKYMKGAVMIMDKIEKKYNCYGYIDFDYDTLIQKLKQLQGLLFKINIEEIDVTLSTKLSNEIGTIIKSAQGSKSIALPDEFKKDFLDMFFYNKELYSYKDQADYRGFQNKTITGKTCQNWTSQSPHQHSRTNRNYPNKGIGNHNYCRNPDGEPGIWCYTTDPRSRWEHCKPLNNVSAILSESYFKRQGISKKFDNWISFIKNKKRPIDSRDYNVIKNSNTGKIADTQSPHVTFFTPLRIVSAGSSNAEQEQVNIPSFDIKDNGGYNLFRAVITEKNDDIPIITKSYIIKDSCKKEKKGSTLEVGNTPLILQNFARDITDSNNNRYDSSQYFGYPKLYIIENINTDGRNLNNMPKTYYLSYSGNTTIKTRENSVVKPLYHIRTYNPNSGEFDYAFDVGSTDASSNVSLKVGKVDPSIETSLFTIEPTATIDDKISLLNYGFKGFGENMGKNHYFYHNFDNSGREYQTLKAISENDAKILKLNKITV